MKIIHHLTIYGTKKSIQEYAKLGVEIHEGVCTFTVDEAHINWQKIQTLNKKYNLTSIVDTKFTVNEKANADYLLMTPTWHLGYPEPSEDFGYRLKTFSNTHCQECGSGLIQKNAFFLKKAPKLSSKRIFQLNWVFDEYFVDIEVFESLFRPLGIGGRSVQLLNSQQEVPGIIQLDIPETSISFDLTNYPHEECNICHRKKYRPISRGLFPSLKTTTDLHLFKGAEYFGSGHRAFKAVVVSAVLYDVIRQGSLKGVSFVPLGPM